MIPALFDQNVHGAFPAEHRVRELSHAGPVAHVDVPRLELAAEPAQPGGQVAARLRHPPARADDVGPGGGERPAGGEADPAGGSRDQRNLAGEVEGRPGLLILHCR
jgi:hypothetical protein